MEESTSLSDGRVSSVPEAISKCIRRRSTVLRDFHSTDWTFDAIANCLVLMMKHRCESNLDADD